MTTRKTADYNSDTDRDTRRMTMTSRTDGSEPGAPETMTKTMMEIS
jgi:hypothetical protein